MTSLLTRRRFRATRHEREGLNPLEHTEAIRLMDVVRLHEGKHPELRWLFHAANGGWRKKAVAAKLKAEGVKPGVADYFLPVARRDKHGLFLELKTLTGRPSPEQRQFAQDMELAGYEHHFCRGWVRAWEVICEYLGIESRAQ